MPSKLFSLIIAVLFALASLWYFSFSSSYQKSLQARWYYFTGDYEYALKIADEALKMEPYNRMAMTVVTQSRIAMKFVRYNYQAKEYLDKIETIVSKKTIEKSDKIRIKFMCDVMIEQYPYLVATVLTDESLKEESHTYFLQFKQLHAKITESL